MEEMNFQPMTARQSYNRMGLALLVMGAVSTAASLLLSLLLGVLSIRFPWIEGADWLRTLASVVPLYCAAMPIGYLLMKKVVISKPDSEKMLPGDFIISLLMCLPLMYLGNIIGNLLSALLSGGQAENPVEEMSQLSPLNILILVVIGPALEEFFFRRQIIDRLGRFGEKQVILFSALAFGLFHMNLFQFFYAFMLGLVLGYVYTRSRKLRYTVAIHMIINLTGGVLPTYFLQALDGLPLETLENFRGTQAQMMVILSYLPQLIAFAIYNILMVIAVIVGIVFLFTKGRKYRLEPAPAQIPDGQARRTIYGAPWVIVFILFCVAMCVVSLITSSI